MAIRDVQAVGHGGTPPSPGQWYPGNIVVSSPADVCVLCSWTISGSPWRARLKTVSARCEVHGHLSSLEWVSDSYHSAGRSQGKSPGQAAAEVEEDEDGGPLTEAEVKPLS